MGIKIRKNESKVTFEKNGGQTNFQINHVEIDGLHVTWLESGKGKDLIFIPGWMGSWSIYIELIAQLSKHYHVKILDLPGFSGDTEASSKTHDLFFYVDFVNKLIDKIQTKPFFLMGISLGGTVALLYSSLHPRKIKKIVVQSSPYRGKSMVYCKKPLIRLASSLLSPTNLPRPLLKIWRHWFFFFGIEGIIKNMAWK